LDNSGQSKTKRQVTRDQAFLPQPANGVCGRLGDKWTVQVIWRLSLAEGRRLRFSHLKREIDGITQRMLTLTLRGLERDGFVRRHYFPEVPPRVEYELTELGAGILASLQALNSGSGTTSPASRKTGAFSTKPANRVSGIPLPGNMAWNKSACITF